MRLARFPGSLRTVSKFLRNLGMYVVQLPARQAAGQQRQVAGGTRAPTGDQTTKDIFSEIGICAKYEFAC